MGESVDQPLRHCDNNVHGSQVLLQAFANARVLYFFSSSAKVYGELVELRQLLTGFQVV